MENYLPPRGDLDASSLPPCGELLSPRGELHFSTGFRCYDRESCVFLFPGGLVRTFSSSSARRFHHFLDWSAWINLSWVVPTLRTEFGADVTIGLRDSWKLVVIFCLHRLLDFPPWTNISWWFQHKCRTLLPTLQSDFVIHENLLWYFFFFVVVLCLVMTFIGQLLYCLLPTLQSDLYCILFRNYLSLLTLILDLLVGHPLGGIVWSIVFLYQYSHCCCFTVCCNSPLPHNRDRNYIE